MRKSTLKLKWLGVMLLPLGLGMAWLASRYPAQVEQIYSNEIYPVWGQFISRTAGKLPFSVMELLLGILVMLLFYLLGQGILRRIKKSPRRRGAALQKKLMRLATLVGLLYLFFLFCWGLNYYRQPFAVIAGFDQTPAARDELFSLCT